MSSFRTAATNCDGEHCASATISRSQHIGLSGSDLGAARRINILFTSSSFLLQFLPIVFLGFLILSQLTQRRLAALRLTIASLVFTVGGDWQTCP